MAFDFAEPRGEPALVPADSISWAIFRNPVTLFVGGVAAVVLELAEPSVRTGVWEHSSFRRDPVGRLKRTGFAAMMTVYGPRSAAEAMIAHVVAMHDRVRGETPDGVPYHANDVRLLDWVQATASFGFIHAYSAYARPLDPREVSQAFAEGAEAARLYGATGAPTSAEDWEAMLAATLPALEESPILHEFLAMMGEAPLLPRAMRPVQKMLVRAAVDLVPVEVRARIGLGGALHGLSAVDRKVVKVMAWAAEHAPMPGTPPAEAARRLS
ncbi:oxygenase MpaB family protein [Sphingomonas montanisoli]|nr:oxygenase MpaB family protein [Sphingomonas montanisoli]